MDITLHDASFVVGAEFDHSTRCIDCGAGFSDLTMEKLRVLFSWKKTFTCKRCSHVYRNIYEFDIWVRHDAAKFLKENTVRQHTWFHATDDSDWYQNISSGGRVDRPRHGEGDVMVHLGMEASAYARAQQLYAEFAGYEVLIPEWFLYEVKLVDDAVIFPELQDDEDDFPERSVDTTSEYLEWEPNGVTRYLNAYEQPGSISLLANPKSFTVLNRRTLQLQ
jgi:hypothetical protein